MWGVLREIQGYIGLCLCEKGRVVNGACAGVSRERYDEYLYVWIYWGGFRETGMQCVGICMCGEMGFAFFEEKSVYGWSDR